eukprot:scaffold80350_cov42-Phaeocystis_antarctica.AAC.2
MCGAGGGSLQHPRQAVAGCPVAGPRPGSAELPRAARRALRRHRSPAGALPRGRFDHAAMPRSTRPGCNPMYIRLQP